MLAQPVGHGREVQGGLQEGGGDAEGLGQGKGAPGEEDCTLKAENFVIKGYLFTIMGIVSTNNNHGL